MAGRLDRVEGVSIMAMFLGMEGAFFMAMRAFVLQGFPTTITLTSLLATFSRARLPPPSTVCTGARARWC